MMYNCVAVLLLFIGIACAEEIEIDWKIDTYPARTAMVGDSLTFTWVYTHNVYIHPNGGCDVTGAMLVGAASGATYTFVDSDVGDMVFACDEPYHCGAGQILTVTVRPYVAASARPSGAASDGPSARPSGAASDGPSRSPATDDDTSAPSVTAVSAPPSAWSSDPVTHTVLWDIPAGGGPLPPRIARVGDAVEFVYFYGHNVYVHPTGDCTLDGRVLVGEAGGATYTFTGDDVGDVVFACDESGHCHLGQIMTFAVTGAPPGQPTPSPVRDPTTTTTDDPCRSARLFRLWQRTFPTLY